MKYVKFRRGTTSRMIFEQLYAQLDMYFTNHSIYTTDNEMVLIIMHVECNVPVHKIRLISKNTKYNHTI